MAYYPATFFPFQAFTDNSVVLSGGTLEAYISGTSTPTNMFTDSSGTSAGTSITLNARGEPQVSGSVVNIWLSDSVTYKFVLKDASDATVWEVSGVSAQVDVPTVLDYSASTGSSDNSSAFASMASAKGYIIVPEGGFQLDTTTISVPITFRPGAYLTANSGQTVTIQSEIDSSRQHVLRGGGSYTLSGQRRLMAEWIGILTDNSAATNKTNWDAFLGNQASVNEQYSIEFGSGSYPFTAPFYIRQRLTVEGKGMFSTEISLAGADNHGVECCYVDSDGNITADSLMEASCTFSQIRDVYFNCTSQTFAGSAVRAMFYGAAFSSGILERCRFNCTAGAMDGVLLVPSRANESSNPGLHHATNRSRVRNNRVTNYRDGLVIGRTDDTWSTDEPASGGAGDLIGGDAYELACYDNYFAGSDSLGAQARYSCKINYYDDTAGSVSSARPKPYSVSVYDNTFEHGGDPEDLTGTVTVTNGSTTVTGSGTAFDTELPTPSATHPVAIRVASQTVQVASVGGATSLTLSENWSGSTASGETAKHKSGAGVFVGSRGRNCRVMNNYIDEGVYSVWVGANAKYSAVYDNHGAGAPLSEIKDDSDYDGGVVIRNVKNEGSVSTELTIASGAITIPYSDERIRAYTIDTESDAASDDLDTINGGKADDLITFTAANSARTVVFKDATDNLHLSADFSLDHGQDTITLRKDRISGNWYQVATANNGT